MTHPVRLLKFDNSYARLPKDFYENCRPTSVTAPKLFGFNRALAEDLELNFADYDETGLAAIFSGNHVPAGSDPIAQVYAGHQFGHFVPRLGDGRAILLGEVVDKYNARRDVELKGCGKTAFSRMGDGRAALGPVIREYLVSEAMHALHVPTTRALAAVTTGEFVHREKLLPGAVLTRVAASHIRIGTFEYFAARNDRQSLRILSDYAIDRHYPVARASDTPYAALLNEVIEAQAKLIANWMHVGFIHGVMNTDNMAISGETIDYGPCAFMDHYDPMKVFSSIDRAGRYAFKNQPSIGLWNLTRLAETLLPLFDVNEAKALDIAQGALQRFAPSFEQHWLAGMRKKIGLFTDEPDDPSIIQGLLDLMHRGQADYTLTFRQLALASEGYSEPFREQFVSQLGLDAWISGWFKRLKRQEHSPQQSAHLMRRVNPVYIPRNHRVERVIKDAVEKGDFVPFEKFRAVLSHPFSDDEIFSEYTLPPLASERVEHTFCGT